jgi:hypothetical protein
LELAVRKQLSFVTKPIYNRWRLGKFTRIAEEAGFKANA